MTLLRGLQLVSCALACAACAPAQHIARTPGLDAPYTPGAPMQIVPVAGSKFSVDRTPITCEQLGELAKHRNPSQLTTLGPGSLCDAICLSTIANELGIRAYVSGADGTLHEIRGHL